MKLKKWWKQINTECAHDFMSEWKEAYYYVVKVMQRNMESDNPVHETKTNVWANKVLGQKFNHILSQHVLYINEMKTIFYEKYGNKNSAWVDENVVMPCFEPTEITEALDKLDESITKILNDYDYGLES